MKYSVNHVDDPKVYKQEQNQNYRKRDPVRYLINQAKYRSKKKDWPFSISRSTIEIPTVCPVLGIPLFYSKGKRTDNSYSLDRVNNDKGYVEGNVRVISSLANRLKSNLTTEQVEALLKYMKGITY